METALILIGVIYYLFTCACMSSYLYGITKEMTVVKAIVFLLLTLVLSPIYSTILLGIGVGTYFSKNL